MKTALEKLETLLESEERLVIATTYSNTQQTNQKVDSAMKVIEEMRSAQQGKPSDHRVYTQRSLFAAD
jgi:hypothetical protein